MNAILTRAFNKIPSTMTWGSKVAGGAFREGSKAFNKGLGLKGAIGKGTDVVSDAWKNGSLAGRASMVGTAGAAGVAGTAGAIAGADFINPWGLGWGD